MSINKSYDAVIIGGGHNGLVCAFYLARRGMKCCVLERSSQVGGAAITEELLPGYRFTTFSYAISLLRPEIGDLLLKTQASAALDREKLLDDSS